MILVCLLLFNLFTTSDSDRINGEQTGPDSKNVFFNAQNVPPHVRNCSRLRRENNNKTSKLPYHDLHMKWMKEGASRNVHGKANISLEAAYEFPDQIAIQITSQSMFGRKVYCHYYDSKREPIGEPFESNVFPQTVIYCEKRFGTKYVSLTRMPDAKPEYPSIPLIDRTMKEPEHFFSVCVAPFYGNESKWLMIAEFVEFYKLQGATYFYFYIVEMNTYDRMIVDDYVRAGEVEVLVMHDRFQKADKQWHTNVTEFRGIRKSISLTESKWNFVTPLDCLLRSRYHSKWAAFVDLDERLTMIASKTTIADYLSKIEDPSIGSLQFRQRWILKTEFQPAKYLNETETIKWMPTQRYTNTSHVGPNNHTAKCIIDPLKVGVMFIHYPERFYPGFKQYQMEPDEGIVRHYRDQTMWNWGKKWLKEVTKFGEF